MPFVISKGIENMVKKQCKQCHRDFKVTREHRIYCSSECAYVALRKQWYNSQHKYRGKQKLERDMKQAKIAVLPKDSQTDKRLERT